MVERNETPWAVSRCKKEAALTTRDPDAIRMALSIPAVRKSFSIPVLQFSRALFQSTRARFSASSRRSGMVVVLGNRRERRQSFP